MASRINVLIAPEQYQRVHDASMNLSRLLRDLLQNHFSASKIVLSVSPLLKTAYQDVITKLGAEDQELEPYFLNALDAYLADKTSEMDTLRKKLKTGGDG